jgi:hypothetical protein
VLERVPLPDDILLDAKELFGLNTAEEVMQEALRQFQRRLRLKDLCDMLGKTDLDMTQEKLEWMRGEP